MRLRRVEYHDDPVGAGELRTKETSFDDFDGLGHYRDATATGNFNDDSRETSTRYNPGNNTLVIDPDDSDTTGSTFVLPGVNDPWLLETFTKRTVEEGGDTSTTEFCFDADTGFLDRTRRWAGPAKGGTDLVTVFIEEEDGGLGTGRVRTEIRYGGDPGGVGTTSGTCGETTLGTPQSRMEHAYSYGVLSNSRYVDPLDDLEDVLEVVDTDVDKNTGLVKTSRDSADLATDFVYDSMGRLVREAPQTPAAGDPERGAWTIYTYELPPPGSFEEPRLTVERCPNGVSSCSGVPLSYMRARYDGLGRQIWERIELPTNDSEVTASRRSFEYDAFGRKTVETRWGDTNLKTEFTYDRFGRIFNITYPEGAPTLFRYRGEQRIDRSDKVATAAGGAEHYVCYREEYDALGRLIFVNEDRASTGMTGLCEGEAERGIVTTYQHECGKKPLFYI